MYGDIAMGAAVNTGWFMVVVGKDNGAERTISVCLG